MGKIEFKCIRCGAFFSVDGSLAGRKAQCKQCGLVMRVPSPSPRTSRRACPICGREMPPQAVICVGCGYNSRLGRQVEEYDDEQ